MVQKSKKIKIAFCLDLNSGWLGGLNYYKNVLMAATLANQDQAQYEFIVFHGKKSQVSSLRGINNLLFVETSLLDRFSIPWFLNKLSFKLVKTHVFLERFLAKNDIELLSHSNFYFRKIKTLGWIPDFQHKYLTHLFSEKETEVRECSYNLMAQLNDSVVFSSHNALEDFLKFYKPAKSQSHYVLQFAPFIEKEIVIKNDVLTKFDINKEFFYIPNQFWVHKNHIFLLEAFAKISDKVDCILVFSGNMDDYRFPDYKHQINQTIEKLKISSKVKFLGIIEYGEVLQLILNSKAVINPSLFEGWSSTVEEAKALDKTIILSDIAVHLEQAPKKGHYYKQDSQDELAKKIVEVYEEKNVAEKYDFNIYKQSFLKFGNQYLSILEKILFS